MKNPFRDRWGSFSGRGGKKPPAPDPTPIQAATLARMHGEGRTQVAIAEELGVPRSRVRIWYRRRGLDVHPQLRPKKTKKANEIMWTHVSVGPDGNVLGRHRSEAKACHAIYGALRQMGCTVRPIQGID